MKDRDMSPFQADLISIVVPLLDEAESLPELMQSIFASCANTGIPCEVIAVDDGSTDESVLVLKELRAQDPRIKILVFRRNFGKAAALDAGFRAAKGDVIFTMDADLQDDPREIPRFLEELSKGLDLVSGWKAERHDPLTKTLPSLFFNWVTSLFSGVRLHDFNCGFKCYRREVTQSLQVYGENHRFLPAIAHMQGFRVGEMVVKHHARPYGVSKYGLSRFVNGFLDLCTVVFTTRYLKKPLHFFGPPGALLFILGSIVNVWLAVSKIFYGQGLSNRPLLFLGVLLMIVGLQLFSIGLVGEMITRGQKEAEYKIREFLE
jgi:glycosyltransferase involved in cell wall biosynthesis